MKCRFEQYKNSLQNLNWSGSQTECLQLINKQLQDFEITTDLNWSSSQTECLQLINKQLQGFLNEN